MSTLIRSIASRLVFILALLIDRARGGWSVVKKQLPMNRRYKDCWHESAEEYNDRVRKVHRQWRKYKCKDHDAISYMAMIACMESYRREGFWNTYGCFVSDRFFYSVELGILDAKLAHEAYRLPRSAKKIIWNYFMTSFGWSYELYNCHFRHLRLSDRFDCPR